MEPAAERVGRLLNDRFYTQRSPFGVAIEHREMLAAGPESDDLDTIELSGSLSRRLAALYADGVQSVIARGTDEASCPGVNSCKSARLRSDGPDRF